MTTAINIRSRGNIPTENIDTDSIIREWQQFRDALPPEMFSLYPTTPKLTSTTSDLNLKLSTSSTTLVFERLLKQVVATARDVSYLYPPVQRESIYQITKDIQLLLSDVANTDTITYVVSDLPNIFHLVDASTVRNVLVQHPNLVQLLNNLSVVVQDYFQSLKYILLKKDEDFTDRLQAFLVVDSDVDNALDVLDEFDTSWWLEQASKYNYKLSVHLEFAE